MRDIVLGEIPGCNVSLSCEVLPQIREYYRLATVILRTGQSSRYIAQLDQRLSGAGIATGKYISRSNGGMATLPPPPAAPSPCRGRPAASWRACSPAT